MKKYIYFCFLALGLTLLSCGKDDSPKTVVENPEITGFTPEEGPVGTAVTINGKNFSTTAAANTVKIGTTVATVTSATATKLVVKVPEGATTGRISVTVDDYTYSSAKTFTVTEIVQPLSIVLNKNETTLYPYDTYMETLSVTSDLEGNTLTWASDDETVAIVDQNGVVTPLKVGTAKVTAAAGGGTAECTINVVDGPVTKLELDKTELELFTDDTAVLEISVLEAAVESTSPAVWSSDNEGVATVDQEGNIVAIAPGEANITATVDNESATSVLTVNPNFYVVGESSTNNIFTAILWKNGQPSVLSDNAKARSVFVSDSNIYVAGFGSGNNGVEAKLWENNTPLTVFGFTKARPNSVYVEGQNVYMAGSRESNNGTYEAILWTNGAATTLSDGTNDAYAESVFVSGEDVYVAGYEIENNISVAKVWKNGTEEKLSDGINDAYAYSVYVDGEDVYVGGSFDGEARIWKNGSNLQHIMNQGYVTSLVVKNEQIYALKNEDESITVWKNGGGLYTLTNGSNAAEGQSIQVYGEDVYVVGYEANNNGIKVAKMWKNDIPTDLTNGDGNNTHAYSIFIN
ncbi:Ig-like domain-containing protein [Flagellimonas sp.]|uniref:Ig-like domain-containing protein n=1 Tax=Flagellimonas sp. TaxID=2058762 RepID=UPI003B5B5D71